MSDSATRTQRVYDPQTNTIKEFQVRPFRPKKPEWPPKDAQVVTASPESQATQDQEPPKDQDPSKGKAGLQKTTKKTTTKTSEKDKSGPDERN